VAKAGFEYQELVAAVASALDPGAKVKTGQWLEGPDGSREVDVEVRGFVNKRAWFILIECKDWTRPIDIQEIDKLDSKRHDLGADETLIYSNSGFTSKALRKASRVGIRVLSALASGDQRVKFRVHRAVIAAGIQVDTWRPTLFFGILGDQQLPEGWDIRKLTYDGLPVVNWFQSITMALLRKHCPRKQLDITLVFRQELQFHLGACTIWLRGLRLDMVCSQKWLSQIVEEEVSLGYFDHITRQVSIPNQQYWTIGPFRRDEWKELQDEDEYEIPDEADELGQNQFRLGLILYRPIVSTEPGGTPALDGEVSECVVHTAE